MNKYKLDKNGLKMCSKCNQKKTLEEYTNLKKGRYGKCSYCRDCGRVDSNKWVKENVEHIRERWSKRFREDNNYKLQCNLRYAISRYIIDKKGKSTKDIIGETYDNVRLHIERQFKEGMEWSNHGQWHIDHIIPLSSGNNREEYIKLNHYTNLQPLWKEENLKKGARLDWE